MLIWNRLAVVSFLVLLPVVGGTEPAKAPNRNAQFGTPSAAGGKLIERPQYVLSYSEDLHRPLWVSWRLVAGDIGKAVRGPFMPDPLLTGKAARIRTGIYTGTGFDRGHLCPSADRSDNERNNDATFFLTNVAPQAPQLNEHTWERLEAYCRELAQAGNELHIVAGTYGAGGKGREGFARQIGIGKVRITVPRSFWKVVLVMPKSKADAPYAVAVLMPNDQAVAEDWTHYRVSVADVEATTGYRFFPLLDATTSKRLRTDHPADVLP